MTANDSRRVAMAVLSAVALYGCSGASGSGLGDGGDAQNGEADGDVYATGDALGGGDWPPGYDPRKDGGTNPGADSGTSSCKTGMVVIGRPGTTSSCSFAVPASVSPDQVNLVFGGRRLCEQGSHNCSQKGGWFWFGDEVALCDDTCLSWENSGANLILEIGCPSETCY